MKMNDFKISKIFFPRKGISMKPLKLKLMTENLKLLKKFITKKFLGHLIKNISHKLCKISQ